jgi:hypothetical protein
MITDLLAREYRFNVPGQRRTRIGHAEYGARSQSSVPAEKNESECS